MPRLKIRIFMQGQSRNHRFQKSFHCADDLHKYIIGDLVQPTLEIKKYSSESLQIIMFFYIP